MPKPEKPKPKPKAKPQEYDESSEEDVRAPPNTPIDKQALASEILGMLQQRYNKSAARRNHDASWFQNM